jgi:hypothetical protein
VARTNDPQAEARSVGGELTPGTLANTGAPKGLRSWRDYEEHAEAAREGARGFSRERIRAFLGHLFRRGEQTEMSVPP